MSITGLKIRSFILISTLFLIVSGSSPDGRQDIPLTAVVDALDLDYQYSRTTGTFWIDAGTQDILFIDYSNKVYTGSEIVYLQHAVRVVNDIPVVGADGVNLILKVCGKEKPWRYNGSNLTFESKTGETSRIKPTATITPSSKKHSPTSQSYTIDTIIIDPGHGGKDPGGIGVNGIKEKDIVLSIGKELKRELKKRLRGKKIIMTREDDRFIPLEERGSTANAVDGSENPIFISIHANVSFTPDASGFESYFLSIDPFGERARDVAEKENSVLNFEIEDYNEYIQEILNRIVDVEYRRESKLLAGDIQKRLRGTVGGQTADRGVKSAFFYVLKASKMPAVLVEIGFVTNRSEAARLQSPDFQKKIAKGIALGIEDFIEDFQESRGFTE